MKSEINPAIDPVQPGLAELHEKLTNEHPGAIICVQIDTRGHYAIYGEQARLAAQLIDGPTRDTLRLQVRNLEKAESILALVVAKEDSLIYTAALHNQGLPVRFFSRKEFDNSKKLLGDIRQGLGLWPWAGTDEILFRIKTLMHPMQTLNPGQPDAESARNSHLRASLNETLRARDTARRALEQTRDAIAKVRREREEADTKLIAAVNDHNHAVKVACKLKEDVRAMSAEIERLRGTPNGLITVPAIYYGERPPTLAQAIAQRDQAQRDLRDAEEKNQALTTEAQTIAKQLDEALELVAQVKRERDVFRAQLEPFTITEEMQAHLKVDPSRYPGCHKDSCHCAQIGFEPSPACLAAMPIQTHV